MACSLDSCLLYRPCTILLGFNYCFPVLFWLILPCFMFVQLVVSEELKRIHARTNKTLLHKLNGNN